MGSPQWSNRRQMWWEDSILDTYVPHVHMQICRRRRRGSEEEDDDVELDRERLRFAASLFDRDIDLDLVIDLHDRLLCRLGDIECLLRDDRDRDLPLLRLLFTALL